ncbi:MAG: curli production assembly protein CsgG [Acidobacteria bacterium]|nr:curli production assembly protein CsgG [Acidobacteriota bacterium]
MMRPSLVILVLASASLAAWSQAPQSQASQKKRVAVFDFDNAAAQGGLTLPFFQTKGPDLGKAAAELLITKLVQDGNASVIERNAIDKLLAEQNLTNSDRTDPLTAAKLGRVLGVDAIILGTITHYDYDDKITGGGGARFGGFAGSSMKLKHDIKAKVIITTRLVSPDSAEVLMVSEGLGQIDRKDVKVDMRNRGSGTNNPTMDECLDKAIAQLATQLESEFPKLPPRNTAVEGMVADASESGQLVLNVGARDGVKPGDHLQIWRAGKEIRDPVSGKVLLHDDTLLGEAVVTEVKDNFAIAHYSGSESVKVRDLVKSKAK